MRMCYPSLYLDGWGYRYDLAMRPSRIGPHTLSPSPCTSRCCPDSDLDVYSDRLGEPVLTMRHPRGLLYTVCQYTSRCTRHSHFEPNISLLSSMGEGVGFNTPNYPIPIMDCPRLTPILPPSRLTWYGGEKVVSERHCPISSFYAIHLSLIT